MTTSTLDKRIQGGAVEDLNRLELHLQSQLNGRVRDLHLRAHDRGLIIRGHASTYYAKQLAQHLVMTCTTLPIEANEIKVQQELD